MKTTWTLPVRLFDDPKYKRRAQWRKQIYEAQRAACAVIRRYPSVLPVCITIERIAPRTLRSPEALYRSAAFLRRCIAERYDVKDDDARIVWRVLQTSGFPHEYAAIVTIVALDDVHGLL